MDQLLACARRQVVIDRLEGAAAAPPGHREQTVGHRGFVVDDEAAIGARARERKHASRDEFDAGEHQIDDRWDGAAIARETPGAFAEDARLACRVAQCCGSLRLR